MKVLPAGVLVTRGVQTGGKLGEPSNQYDWPGATAAATWKRWLALVEVRVRTARLPGLFVPSRNKVVADTAARPVAPGELTVSMVWMASNSKAA